MILKHFTNDISDKPRTPFLVGSVVFHAVIVALLIIGLPHVTPDLPIIDNPVPIEIVDIDEITQTTAPAQKSEKKSDKPAKKTEDPVKEPVKKAAPQVTAKTPPKPIPPKPPAEEVVVPDKKKAPEPVKKPETKPKTPEKPRERMLTASNEEQQEEFQSLLRNLMPAESEEAAADSQVAGEKPNMFTPLGERMTISEQDALRRQLAACWNLLAGARYAEDLVVEIKLFMNADRTIRSAQIVNQLRYNQDSFFRAAADSALRALNNPHCNPLDLPPEKYEQWKTITVTFDPRSML